MTTRTAADVAAYNARQQYLRDAETRARTREARRASDPEPQPRYVDGIDVSWVDREAWNRRQKPRYIGVTREPVSLRDWDWTEHPEGPPELATGWIDGDDD